MGLANKSELKYVIKDSLSSYTWLSPCSSVDSDAATSALSKRITCYDCIKGLVTDQGSHF